MRILFIEGTPTEYDGVSGLDLPIGGIESAVLQLSRALAARGHDVTVANSCRAPIQSQGVSWIPRGDAAALPADVVIVTNRAPLFRLAERAMSAGARPVLWQHNEMRLEKMIRRGYLWPTLAYRPWLVCSCQYHLSVITPFVPLRARHVIPLAVGEPFIQSQPKATLPPARAIFSSQPFRGFADCVRIWIERIRPAVPDAELVAYVGADAACGFSEAELSRNGIFRHPRVGKLELLKALQEARLLLAPGHVCETFCLAAAEALCSGTPVLTRGIGALRERVRHGRNGIIESRLDRFADAAISILTDDALWRRLHEGALEERERQSWSSVAAQWEAFLSEILES